MSLSLFSPSPSNLRPSRTLKFIPHSCIPLSNNTPICCSRHFCFNSLHTLSSSAPNCHHPSEKSSRTDLLPDNSRKCLTFLKPHFPLLCLGPLGLAFPLSSFASEELPNRINLESILVSIDNFFNRYPFFVATVTFIWLVVIPLTEEYLQKYKFISAINAFKKLRDEPGSQLLDIRDSKSLAYLRTPNLKVLNKQAVQVEFREGDEEGFVKRVLEIFEDPLNTILCIIDNFDGNSIKVAELLVKNGFKEAYAIRGGIRGEKGWQEIQETLLPLSVHVYPKKVTKNPKQPSINGAIKQLLNDNNGNSSSSIKENIDEESSSTSPGSQRKDDHRPLSPYTNYPDMKPPSSPTPSKPTRS